VKPAIDWPQLAQVPSWAWQTALVLAGLALLALALINLWAARRLSRRPRPVPVVYVIGEDEKDTPRPLTLGQKRLAAAIGVPALALGVFGFWLAFHTMKKQLEPTFGDYAGSVVIVIDLSIAVSSAAALLLKWLGIRVSWLRLVPWVLIAVSVGLNVSAGNRWYEKVAHGAMPSIWSVFVEAVIVVVGVRMRLLKMAADRPSWGGRWITYAWPTLCEWLAWTNHPHDKDITVDLDGAVKHLERVRVRKAAARAERYARCGELVPSWLPMWPLTLVSTAAAVIAKRTTERDTARDQATNLSAQLEAVRSELTTATATLASTRAELTAVAERACTAEDNVAALSARLDVARTDMQRAAGCAAVTAAELQSLARQLVDEQAARTNAEAAKTAAQTRIVELNADVEAWLEEATASTARAEEAVAALAAYRENAGTRTGTAGGARTGTAGGTRTGTAGGTRTGTDSGTPGGTRTAGTTGTRTGAAGGTSRRSKAGTSRAGTKQPSIADQLRAYAQELIADGRPVTAAALDEHLGLNPATGYGRRIAREVNNGLALVNGGADERASA
jgi:hypothetical protein